MPLNQPTNTNAADFTGGQPVDCPGGFTSANSQSPNAAGTGAALFPDGITIPAGANLLVNGNAGLMVATFADGTAASSATSATFFVAPRACTIVAIEEVHGVAAGGVSTMTITHETGTQAAGAGTTTQVGSFNLNGTANVPQAATLSATASVLTLAKGDRLSTKYANTIQSSAGITVTVLLAPA